MRVFLLLVAIVVFGAACGSSDDSEAGSGEPSSPIAEFLGEPDFLADEEAARESFVEQERAAEVTIAACMAEQGFEYIPRDVSEGDFIIGGDDEDYGSDEWTKKWGFGITTSWFSSDQVGPELLGYDDSQFQDQIDSDPNQQILEAMTESEREAYEEALWGADFFSFDETLSDEEIQAQLDGQQFEGPGGCQGEAFDDDPFFRFYNEFGVELEALEDQLDADPRIVELEREITECVAERGLEYIPERELWDVYQSELQELESTIDYSAFEESFEEGEVPDPDSFQLPELPAESKAKLAELQSAEIELAVATLECGGGFEASGEVYGEVRAELEQQWLDDNADRVADFAAE